MKLRRKFEKLLCGRECCRRIILFSFVCQYGGILYLQIYSLCTEMIIQERGIAVVFNTECRFFFSIEQISLNPIPIFCLYYSILSISKQNEISRFGYIANIVSNQIKLASMRLFFVFFLVSSLRIFCKQFVKLFRPFPRKTYYHIPLNVYINICIKRTFVFFFRLNIIIVFYIQTKCIAKLIWQKYVFDS